MIALGKHKQARTYSPEFFDALLAAVMELQQEALTRAMPPLVRRDNSIGLDLPPQIRWGRWVSTSQNVVTLSPCLADGTAIEGANFQVFGLQPANQLASIPTHPVSLPKFTR